MIKNAEDTALIYGQEHPYTYFSYIMDTVVELYGRKTKITCVTMDGRTEITFEELPDLFNSGDLCVNITGGIE